LLETSKPEMDGLLDTRPTLFLQMTLLLMLSTLEEMLALPLELSIPMDRMSHTLEQKKESLLEDRSLDLLTSQASFLEVAQDLLTALLTVSLELNLATLLSPTRLEATLTTSINLFNGLDFTSLAMTAMPSTTT